MARSQPITWRNVGINDGSSSASLGNAAAGFGRTAIQGLDILSQQMGDRITREDTLLTNEAIGAALSGGPKVSNNRRVDAAALQDAVEAQATGVRANTALQDTLANSAVARSGQITENAIKVKDLDTYDERWALDQQIAEAEAAYKRNQTAIERGKLDILLAEKEKLAKNEAAVLKFNKDLFGPEAEAARVKKFEEWYKENRHPDATPEDDRLQRENFLRTDREAVFNDPNFIDKAAVELGVPATALYEGSAIGKQAWAAGIATQEEIARQAVAKQGLQEEVMKQAQSFNNGNLGAVRWDGDSFEWGQGTKVTAPVMSATLTSLGVKPDSDEAIAFKNYVQSRFTDASMFEKISKEMIQNGEIPDPKTKDGQGYEQRIDALADQLKQRSEADSKPTFDALKSSGDPYVDAQNYNAAIASRNPPKVTEKSTEAATSSILTDSVEAASAVRQINNDPLTEKDAKASKRALELSIEGVKGAAEDFEIPEDASREIKNLYGKWQATVKVAEGNMYIPEESLGGIGYGDSIEAFRPVKPDFTVKQEYAARAIEQLKELQQLLAAEAMEKDRKKYRSLLDE